ncbi:MAG: GNAT family N-acetyltransferase [Deltaproteobacteria bacterium]|nr:GNAT family N-acetyltransferase [Deltaproteobacteria bacterium]
MRHLDIDKMTNVDKATRDDLGAVKELNALLRLGIDNFYWDSDDYIISALKEERCYVVKDNGEVKGSLIIERRSPDGEYNQDSLAIGIVTVISEYQKKGFGTNLIEAAKVFAFREKKRLYVESFYEYEKLDYYKKLGFKEDDPKEYGGRPYHVLFLDPENIPEFPDMKQIDIGDRLQYLSCLEKMPVVPSDVTFENLFVYDAAGRQISLSTMNNNVIIRTRSEKEVSLYPPVGNNRLDETILDCLDWLKTESEEAGFTCVPYHQVEVLKQETKKKLNIVKDRNSFDYLYGMASYGTFNMPSLRTLRQNLTHFLDKNPEYKDLTYGMIDEVSDFQQYWMKDYTERMQKANKPVTDFIAKENEAITKALSLCKTLGLKIGAIYLDGVIEGFTIASIHKKTAYIHFEKASRKRGAYQALIHLFSQSALENIDTVNKEQDLGIPGLRTSKKRYDPSGYIEKCCITMKAVD